MCAWTPGLRLTICVADVGIPLVNRPSEQGGSMWNVADARPSRARELPEFGEQGGLSDEVNAQQGAQQKSDGGW